MIIRTLQRLLWRTRPYSQVLTSLAPFTIESTQYMVLSNGTKKPFAFKVKTTAPRVYCVRPNAAIIEPGETVRVSSKFPLNDGRDIRD